MRETWGWGRLGLAWLHRHRRGLLLAASFAGIFAGVFALYDLPAEAVLYACALCAVVGAGVGIVDFRRFCARHRALVQLKGQAALALEQLPPPENLLEDGEQALIRELHRQLQEALAQARRQREEALDYCTLWAHQIKTPLAALRLLLDGREDTAALEQELFKLEQYVDMVLQYARLGADTGDLVLRRCALEPVVRGAVRKYAPLFIGKRIRLELGPLEGEALTDEKWLGFVVEQLLSNAVKYTPAGGQVSIYLEGNAQLVVEDTGIGIRPEDLPRVFEKGYTGFNGRAGEASTGIGLFLCRRILTRLSHTIRLESSPGAGTRAIVGLDTLELKPL